MAKYTVVEQLKMSPPALPRFGADSVSRELFELENNSFYFIVLIM